VFEGLQVKLGRVELDEQVALADRAAFGDD
jgi:hypothetical protein